MMSEIQVETSGKKSLLIVIGSGSALAQTIVRDLIGFDLIVTLSTKASKIFFHGKQQDSIQYAGADFDSLREIFESENIPNRNEISRIGVVSFTGQKDDKLLINSTQQSIKDVIEVNFTVNAIASSLIIKKYRGVPISLVFLSSAGALGGGQGTSIYTSSKYALNGLTKSIAIEYGRFGVNANVIALGVLPIGLKQSVPKQQLDQLLSRTANRGFVDLDNVTKTVIFLLNNRDINGSVVHCDGGYF